MAVAGRASPQFVFHSSASAPTRLLQTAVAVLWFWQPAAASQLPAKYDRECYRTAQNQYVLFGSKTTYGAVAGNDLNTPAGAFTHIVVLCYYVRHDKSSSEGAELFSKTARLSLRRPLIQPSRKV